MKQMELNFMQVRNGLYESQEVEVGTDFNLHLERESPGSCRVLQRTAGVSFGIGADIEPEAIIDIDMDGIMYPKTIRIQSGAAVTRGFISTDDDE